MYLCSRGEIREIVALRTEGVDRNAVYSDDFMERHKSPSARRAWIEIRNRQLTSPWRTVALRTEGVDRNV